MSWNRQQVSALIELYKQQELLYVVKNPTYHNKIARTQALEAIANSLQNIRPQTTANDVKTKINSLRTQFNKEITKLRSAPSGAGAETISITLWCFEDLLFLQDQSIASNSTSNLTPAQGYSDWAERVEIEEGTQQPMDILPEEAGCSSEATTSKEPPPSTPTNHISKKRKLEEEFNLPVLKDISSALKSMMETSPEDEWDLVGKFIGSELKMFKNKNLQARCKRALLRLLLDFQDEDE